MYQQTGNFRQNLKLPNRWNEYKAVGEIVSGTRFLPFKTPLKEEICRRSVSQKTNWFTPAMVLERAPNLKLIVDLTQTDRFYQREDFEAKGVKYKKIWCRGGGKQLPSHHIIHEFNRTIDDFLKLNIGGLIGVHCTHGLNRTGYLICKYMVKKGTPAVDAIKAFENARGHKMERDLYVRDILGTKSALPNWRIPSRNPKSPLDGCYEESSSRYRNRFATRSNYKIKSSTGERFRNQPMGVRRSNFYRNRDNLYPQF